MEIYIIVALSLSLIISIVINIQYYRNRKTHKTYDAVNLIHDLTSRKQTLVKIERVAPDTVFLRSPKDLI